MLKLLLATTILTLSAGTAMAQTPTSSAPSQTTTEKDPSAVSTAPEQEVTPKDARITPETVDFVFSEAPDDHVIGSDTAPITLIMYASVTCGHCGHWFQESWPVVKRELVEKGKIRFILRELPTPPAVLSVTGFLMAECGPKDKYFDSIEYQMNHQNEILDSAKNGKAQAEYAKVAEGVGLNTDKEINACLSDEANMVHLRVNGARADAAEVKGVPAFFIGGQVYLGQQEGPALVKLINGMFAKGQSTPPEPSEAEKNAEQTKHLFILDH